MCYPLSCTFSALERASAMPLTSRYDDSDDDWDDDWDDDLDLDDDSDL